jgi:hypothetical protein
MTSHKGVRVALLGCLVAAAVGAGEWVTYTSTGTTLRDVYMVTATNGWAVGDNGQLVHFDGSTWTAATSPTSASIRGLKMLSATSGWAVGTGGVILRYNGSSWTLATSPTSQDLYSVDLVSASDGWACGKGGVLLRYNGASWSVATSPTMQDLNAVDMVASSAVWVAGDAGVIYRYNGASWALQTTGVSFDLYGIALLDGTNGFAVGSYEAVLDYTPPSWTLVGQAAQDLDFCGVDYPAASVAWTLGDEGKGKFYDGNMWRMYNTHFTQTVYGVSFCSAIDGWAVGQGGTILKYIEGEPGVAPASWGKIKAVFQ